MCLLYEKVYLTLHAASILTRRSLASYASDDLSVTKQLWSYLLEGRNDSLSSALNDLPAKCTNLTGVVCDYFYHCPCALSLSLTSKQWYVFKQKNVHTIPNVVLTATNVNREHLWNNVNAPFLTSEIRSLWYRVIYDVIDTKAKRHHCGFSDGMFCSGVNYNVFLALCYVNHVPT